MIYLFSGSSNRGVLYMELIRTVNELKRFIYSNDIEMNEFVEKLGDMVEKARILTKVAPDQQMYDFVIELVAFYIAGGNKQFAELVKSLISELFRLTKNVSEQDYKYFKMLVIFYLGH